MTAKKYVIATIKNWNIDNSKQLQREGEHDIEIIVDKKELTAENISKLQPRYIFFPHWSWKIPAGIYQNWECVVFHMTDLPFGRGGSPLQNLIERGIYQTKISALKVEEEMDAGPIYGKKNLDISSGSANDIFKRAANIIFKEMIPSIIKNEPVPVPQSGQPVIFQRRTEQQSDLAGIANSAKAYDYIRMLDGEGYPPAFIKLGELKYEFTEAEKNGSEVRAKVVIKNKEIQ